MNHSVLTSSFSIPPSFRPLLSKNYLLHWSGDYFLDLYYSHSGRITHQDTLYQIIFDPEQGERTVLSCPKVALSFRSVDGKTGFVIVRGITL